MIKARLAKMASVSTVVALSALVMYQVLPAEDDSVPPPSPPPSSLSFEADLAPTADDADPTTEADPTSDTEPVAPHGHGDDPHLDRLWDRCANGEGPACEQLFLTSPVGSEYERFGVTCGDRPLVADCSRYQDG